MVRCKAGEIWDPLREWGVRAKQRQILRSAAYFLYTATTRVEPNAADGRLSTASEGAYQVPWGEAAG